MYSLLWPDKTLLTMWGVQHQVRGCCGVLRVSLRVHFFLSLICPPSVLKWWGPSTETSYTHHPWKTKTTKFQENLFIYAGDDIRTIKQLKNSCVASTNTYLLSMSLEFEPNHGCFTFSVLATLLFVSVFILKFKKKIGVIGNMQVRSVKNFIHEVTKRTNDQLDKNCGANQKRKRMTSSGV